MQGIEIGLGLQALLDVRQRMNGAAHQKRLWIVCPFDGLLLWRPEMRIGDAAPDVALKQSDGQSVTLSGFWQRQPVVLVFVRHFG